MISDWKRRVEERAVITFGEHDKPEIVYPCEWEYKVIVDAEYDIGELTGELLGEREHTLKPSNTSKGGKYRSYSIRLLVHNEEERRFLFDAFKKGERVKMVL
ncbi:MAG: hypothetical protein B6D59_05055 [Campylobacteraceae bacterium 4484_4]|nr:MAG: hypothetical protein B6D59_05055 [Campylobacteraceae bacterium 4484_4]